MGGVISYPRTTGDRSFAKKRSEVLTRKIEKLLISLRSGDFNISSISDIYALIALIGFHNLPPELRHLLFRLQNEISPSHLEQNVSTHNFRQKQYSYFQFFTILALSEERELKSKQQKKRADGDVFAQVQQKAEIFFNKQYSITTSYNTNQGEVCYGLLNSQANLVYVESIIENQDVCQEEDGTYQSKVDGQELDNTFSYRQLAISLIDKGLSVIPQKSLFKPFLYINLNAERVSPKANSRFQAREEQKSLDSDNLNVSEKQRIENLLNQFRGAVRNGNLATAHMLFFILGVANIPAGLLSEFQGLKNTSSPVKRQKTYLSQNRAQFTENTEKVCYLLASSITKDNRQNQQIWLNCLDELFGISIYQAVFNKNSENLKTFSTLLLDSLAREKALAMREKEKERLLVYILLAYSLDINFCKQRTGLQHFLMGMFYSLKKKTTLHYFLLKKLYEKFKLDKLMLEVEMILNVEDIQNEF